MSDFFSRIMEGQEQAQRQGRIFGLVFGEVRELRDDGVVVQYSSTTSAEPSTPARVATLMAGSGRGTYFMPEVGDEVVVGFELGDMNRPVILGALWSDKDRPPNQADTSPTNNKRTIVSRAGHEVTLDDTPGAGKITIKTQGGMEITLQDGPTPRITVKTTGVVATSQLELDGVAWNHQHATGVGPSGPPLSIVPVP